MGIFIRFSESAWPRSRFKLDQALRRCGSSRMDPEEAGQNLTKRTGGLLDGPHQWFFELIAVRQLYWQLNGKHLELFQRGERLKIRCSPRRSSRMLVVSSSQCSPAGLILLCLMLYNIVLCAATHIERRSISHHGHRSSKFLRRLQFDLLDPGWQTHSFLCRTSTPTDGVLCSYPWPCDSPD